MEQFSRSLSYFPFFSKSLSYFVLSYFQKILILYHIQFVIFHLLKYDKKCVLSYFLQYDKKTWNMIKKNLWAELKTKNSLSLGWVFGFQLDSLEKHLLTLTVVIFLGQDNKQAITKKKQFYETPKAKTGGKQQKS